MRLQKRGALLLLQIFFTLMCPSTISQIIKKEQDLDLPLIYKVPIISSQARAARIAEFVSSHKIPDDIREQKNASNENKSKEKESKNQSTPVTKGTSNNGNILSNKESSNEKNMESDMRQYAEVKKKEMLNGIYTGAGISTTAIPVLTTQRDVQLFDFVPVNLLQEDSKRNSFTPWNEKNFEDSDNISLVPAGSNTRIQVKKGPNGKDYEYEYVYYYYYDEDDESKADGSAAVQNSEEASIKTMQSYARRGNSNRNKYSTFDRTNSSGTTTVGPILNEIIPNGNEIRARKLNNFSIANEEISDERLPTNTRFPPRSRGNHVPELERPSRIRGHRQRLVMDSIDSSDSRNQEGPEFPQNLPNGPIRFLGVTPNESSEEKPAIDGHLKSRRNQEPAPVQEIQNEPGIIKKSSIQQYDNSALQPKKIYSQFGQQTYLPKEEGSNNRETLDISSNFKTAQMEVDSYTESVTDVPDTPTTQLPLTMDKIALDLYAFLQQGRSNLVDFVKDADISDESTDVISDSMTTEFPNTSGESVTLLFDSEESISTIIIPTTTMSTTSIPTSTTVKTTPISTVTTIEESSVTGSSTVRGKFRRPGSLVSRNRFKSNGGPSINSETSAVESNTTTVPTQRTRGRFNSNIGTSGTSNFKRSRPTVQKHQLNSEERIQKENFEKTNSETKPAAGRGRFRGTSTRTNQQARSTTIPVATSKSSNLNNSLPVSSTTSSNFGLHRPSNLNKLSLSNRKRTNRPGISTQHPSVEEGELSTSTSSTHEETSSEPRIDIKSPSSGIRVKPLNKPVIKHGAGRLNIRPRIGQQTTSTIESTTKEITHTADSLTDEPASEGTEEETREALVETKSTTRATTVNPLDNLRSRTRNRIQVHPKTTTARTPLPAVRRSPLLPRRKTTEAPFTELEIMTELHLNTALEESEVTELPTVIETSSITSIKNQDSRGLSSLLASRRRLTPKRFNHD